MKITKRQLRRIIKEEKARLAEANPDGTVSDNEDAEIFVFFADVEERIEELAQFIVMDSERIGGRFRGPGLRKRAFQKVLEIIREDYKF
jgi:hypothetical protein